MTDLPDLLAKIRDSRREVGGELGSAWAGVETYCTVGQPGRPQTREEYEAYLGGLFAHDMRLVNVYGWNVPREGPSAPFSVKNAPGVVQAVANWVSGKALPSDWRGAPPSEGGPPQGAMRLGPKMQRLQQLLAKRREAGDDLSHIVEMMRPMEELMREGKVEAAEQLVDRALRAAQQGGDAPETPLPTPDIRPLRRPPDDGGSARANAPFTSDKAKAHRPATALVSYSSPQPVRPTGGTAVTAPAILS